MQLALIFCCTCWWDFLCALYSNIILIIYQIHTIIYQIGIHSISCEQYFMYIAILLIHAKRAAPPNLHYSFRDESPKNLYRSATMSVWSAFKSFVQMTRVWFLGKYCCHRDRV